MYRDCIDTVAGQAAAKLTHQRISITGHLIRSALAGMYVGVCIVLIFTIGAAVSQQAPHLVKLLMGVCFGGALTLVVFAGAELFTGSNMVLTLGLLSGRNGARDLAANWSWTWLGNLLGSVLLAVLVIRSGIFNTDPFKTFVLKIVEAKMTLPVEQLFIRAILANWLVCLGVWMAARVKSEVARILLIWWCMFIFITCGFEHSVANMCGLMLGLLLPHEAFAGVTWGGYVYNVAIATAGNIVGGVVLVAGLYWYGSPAPKVESQRQEPESSSVSAIEAPAVA